MDEFSVPTNIEWKGSVGRVEYGGGDKNMLAMFYMRPQHNPAKSTEAGRPYYDDVPFVRIHPPGERLNIVDRPATGADAKRFPIQWAQFQQNKEQIPDGTPIDLLYPEHPSVAATLRASGVFTIEQCAELSGPAIDQIGMGAQRYTNDAQRYLQLANKGVKATELRKELEERDSQIRTLTHTVEALQGEIQRMREMTMAAANMNAAQAMAGQQQRPQFPGGRQMAPTFDAQTAQINATHATGDIAKKKRSRARIQA